MILNEWSCYTEKTEHSGYSEKYRKKLEISFRIYYNIRQNGGSEK